MPVPLNQLHQKATGTVEAFGKMTAKQREQRLTPVAAEDYNKLRSLVLEAKPDLEAVLPPAVEIEQDGPYTIPKATYQDVHAFTQQIANFINPGPGGYTRTRLA